MRELMKENGIGRPSTRASIIETLFKRKYIERQKKIIVPTQTGIDLIDLIDNELLKSAELTGLWEKKLREIERGEYHASTFINQMKKMVDNLVYEVRSSNKKVRLSAENHKQKSVSVDKKSNTKKTIIGKTCPKCKEGKLLKGSSAFGCSNFGNSCDFKLDFTIFDKKISENQLIRLLEKGSTTNLKGFTINEKKQVGSLVLNNNFKVEFKVKEKKEKQQIPDKIICPKCKKGIILKGKSAYGCSEFNKNCDFLINFESIKEKAKGKTLTRELVYNIIIKS
ncbi:MAG: hypothetical protein CR961_00670 [Polaribacter sp.]|nr:MAG: hypothetical protein CR961_00670 [Polaribacter sp.]